MVLLGFALGWALLAVSSTRFTDQPQRWAAVPAVFMAASGVAVLVAPGAVLDALDWVWPPAVVVLALWAWNRARRDLRSPTRTWVVYPVLVTLVVMAVGGAYEVVGRATAPDVTRTGQLVDVGAYRLHLECTGSGTPTVVLEPGAGGSAASMGLIAPVVARETRVCVYDRAGRGWSDPAPRPPDGTQIATDLHTLLSRAHVPGPYVLAGHSFGGLYVRTYAARYPDEVAGLVLIDSTAANTRPVPPQAAGSYSLLQHGASLLATTSRVGVSRILASTSCSGLPARYRDDCRATAATGTEMAGVLGEYGVASRSASEAGALRDLDAKPLVVLTAGEGSRPGWMGDQDQMARLSSDSVHRVERGATHAAFVDDPAHAAAVTRAVHDVVVALRTGSPLPRP
jgi:pimeloyl-ACP methyl ester carboxylesterase